jgi:hypothetical protein
VASAVLPDFPRVLARHLGRRHIQRRTNQPALSTSHPPPDTRQTGEGRQSADGSTSADSQAADVYYRLGPVAATSVGPRMAGASAVDLLAGDLPCTEDAGKAEPARSSTGRETEETTRRYQQPRCEGCAGLREPPCRASHSRA